MIETFLILLAGHLLADFVFQPDMLVRMKRKWLGILLHIAIVGALALIVLAPRSPLALAPLLIVVITHLAMDYIKVHYLGDKLWTFALDQAVHLGVIAALAAVWPDIASQSLWGLLPAPTLTQVCAGWTLVCGLIVGVAVGGVVIKKLVDPLSPTNRVLPVSTQLVGAATPAAPDYPIIGMRSAGRYIGWLERGLAITFILVNQPEGVGFLLAAKSILRFRDVQDEKDRHQAEYIIIGTFLSFGWAILAALLTRAAMAHWLA